MIDEQDDNQSISKANKNLDRRLAKSPRVYQRLHQIAYGVISIDQTLLRIGRRGKRVKPFCQDSGIAPQGCSLRLQPALVDFGAKSSFSRAVKRFEEHNHISISRHKIYENTLKHGREMGGFQPLPPAKALQKY